MSGAAQLLMALMSGMWNALITIGNAGSVYGYSNFTGNVYGSITRATFTDRGGNSRTITAVHWSVSGSGSLQLRLSGTGISDSDTTFTSLRLGGQVYTRASATYSSNDAAGNTAWLWSLDTSGFPTSGTISAALN